VARELLEDPAIIQLNIRHYSWLLERERSEAKRQQLRTLLAEAQAQLLRAQAAAQPADASEKHTPERDDSRQSAVSDPPP